MPVLGPPMGHPQGPPLPPQHMGYGGGGPQYPQANMGYGNGPPMTPVHMGMVPPQQPPQQGGQGGQVVFPHHMTDEIELAQKRKDFETLCQIINAWNANRLDLFALSLPNEVGLKFFLSIACFVVKKSEHTIVSWVVYLDV